MLDEETSIGVQDEIRWRTPEREGHREDPFLAPFDFDEGADRGFVNRNRDVFGAVLLAVLLVAKPDVQAELFEHALHDLAVANHRLIFVADLHRPRKDRTLERQKAFAGFSAEAQHAAAPSQRFIFGVEECVFLQAARSQRRGAGREYRGPRFIWSGEPEFDFTLDHQRHVEASVPAFALRAAASLAEAEGGGGRGASSITKEIERGGSEDPPLHEILTCRGTVLFLRDDDGHVHAVAQDAKNRGAARRNAAQLAARVRHAADARAADARDDV